MSGLKSFFRNLIFALIFVFGFFIGTGGGVKIYNLSACAAMGEIQRKKPLFYESIITAGLPTDFANKEEEPEKRYHEQKEITPNNAKTLTAKNTSGNIEIANETEYSFDIDSLMSEPLVTYSEGKKKVLIIHSHTCESYTPTEKYYYDAGDSYRTTDENMNVVAVGTVIEEKLREEGIEVIHDKTSHDWPEYSGAYRRALESIEKDLYKNPDISIVIDIHRDAISDGEGGYYRTLANINGEDCAQCMIVIGTDGKGLEHKKYRENIKYGLRLQKIMNEKYPSLARPLNIRMERFNGHVREGAMIIEVGSNGNTLEEAKRCGQYVGECVAELAKQQTN